MSWPGDLGPAFRAEAVLDPKAFAAIRAIGNPAALPWLIRLHDNKSLTTGVPIRKVEPGSVSIERG